MILPIKDEYFEQIFNGEKEQDYRDAHITFVNEVTKEKLVKNISKVRIIDREALPEKLRNSELFTDDKIVVFEFVREE